MIIRITPARLTYTNSKAHGILLSQIHGIQAISLRNPKVNDSKYITKDEPAVSHPMLCFHSRDPSPRPAF